MASSSIALDSHRLALARALSRLFPDCDCLDGEDSRPFDGMDGGGAYLSSATCSIPVAEGEPSATVEISLMGSPTFLGRGKQRRVGWSFALDAHLFIAGDHLSERSFPMAEPLAQACLGTDLPALSALACHPRCMAHLRSLHPALPALLDSALSAQERSLLDQAASPARRARLPRSL